MKREKTMELHCQKKRFSKGLGKGFSTAAFFRTLLRFHRKPSWDGFTENLNQRVYELVCYGLFKQPFSNGSTRNPRRVLQKTIFGRFHKKPQGFMKWFNKEPFQGYTENYLGKVSQKTSDGSFKQPFTNVLTRNHYNLLRAWKGFTGNLKWFMHWSVQQPLSNCPTGNLSQCYC